MQHIMVTALVRCFTVYCCVHVYEFFRSIMELNGKAYEVTRPFQTGVFTSGFLTSGLYQEKSYEPYFKWSL